MIAVAGNVLRFQPPLVITYEQLDYALNTIENALQALQDGQLNNYNIDGQGLVKKHLSQSMRQVLFHINLLVRRSPSSFFLECRTP